MKVGLFAEGVDNEHKCVGFVEISSICVSHPLYMTRLLNPVTPPFYRLYFMIHFEKLYFS